MCIQQPYRLVLSRFMERPTVEHLTTLKRVLRYLRGTIGNGLVYLKGQSKARLVGCCESDFSSDKQDRKSISGQVFFLNDMLISWASKLQKTIALSSYEAEYVASTVATCQVMWLNQLISELSGIDEIMVKLLVDTKSAIIDQKSITTQMYEAHQHSSSLHTTVCGRQEDSGGLC